VKKTRRIVTTTEAVIVNYPGVDSVVGRKVYAQGSFLIPLAIPIHIRGTDVKDYSISCCLYRMNCAADGIQPLKVAVDRTNFTWWAVFDTAPAGSDYTLEVKLLYQLNTVKDTKLITGLTLQDGWSVHIDANPDLTPFAIVLTGEYGGGDTVECQLFDNKDVFFDNELSMNEDPPTMTWTADFDDTVNAGYTFLAKLRVTANGPYMTADYLTVPVAAMLKVEKLRKDRGVKGSLQEAKGPRGRTKAPAKAPASAKKSR